jgi:N-methylhydantoinase B
MGLYSAALPTVIDTIVRAVGTAELPVAAGGHHASFSAHWFYGTDPATGELFQQLDTGHGGWGATAGADGAGPYKSMAHGDTLDVPVEVQETLCPLYIESNALRTDSAGDGARRSGLGTEKVVRVLADSSVSVQIDRTVCLLWGLNGGTDGRGAIATVEPVTGKSYDILKGTATMKAGDRFRLKTGGGGGFGASLDRSPKAVAADVAAGYITPGHAADVYGVVTSGDGGLDAAATAAKRQKMKAAQ